MIYTNRKTKIVCTIGPSSESPEMLAELMRAGMNVARLNFSHGTHQDHAQRIQTIRRVAQELDAPIAILQDLQGPKIRVGLLPNGPVELIEGNTFAITTEDVDGSNDRVSTDHKGIVNDVQVGKHILLDDGNLKLVVTDVTQTDVITKVLVGGVLKQRKGINLPGVTVSIPALTEKDKRDLVFGLENGVDYVAVSFVQRPEDIALVREVMRSANPAKEKTPVIAKLEKPNAIENLEAILEVVEGVMLARGDLGVELSPEKVPSAQKHIIQRANETGKIVITATQMLESMKDNPMPTRAEASDVANAIFDGTDAVMLSAETASGSYPIETVKMMAAIAEEAERHTQAWSHQADPNDKNLRPTILSLSRAAREMASSLHVKAIAIFSRSGNSARIIAKHRPDVPVITMTPYEETYRRMALVWGVKPFKVARAFSIEEMTWSLERVMANVPNTSKGDQVVVMGGLPVSRMGSANFILLHRIGENQSVDSIHVD